MRSDSEAAAGADPGPAKRAWPAEIANFSGRRDGQAHHLGRVLEAALVVDYA